MWILCLVSNLVYKSPGSMGRILSWWTRLAFCDGISLYRSCFISLRIWVEPCLQLTEFREREMRRHNPHCYSVPLEHLLKHMHDLPSIAPRQEEKLLDWEPHTVYWNPLHHQSPFSFFLLPQRQSSMGGWWLLTDVLWRGTKFTRGMQWRPQRTWNGWTGNSLR